MGSNEKFVFENYAKNSTFSSFLPGISGEKGIPIWCYYVNRGQAVVSFGVEDKDHSIMEFYPAHQAYQNVKITGFRTFLRKDGEYFEAFANEENSHRMSIEMNRLTVVDTDTDHGIETEVSYTTLPMEAIGGLVRKVTFKNISSEALAMEVLDGMPAIIPYDIGLEALKEMGQTVKAWMEVEHVETKVPYFKARASSNDTATVTPVFGGNYSLCMTEKNQQLAPIVDPEIVFGYDNSMQVAQGFKDLGLAGLYEKKQVHSNQLFCSFYGTEVKLEAGEEFSLYHIIGQVDNRETLEKFLEKKINVTFFQEKEQCATSLTEELCEVIHTKTGHKDFDAYCKYTYMDNVLRGGRPIELPGGKIFYVYSRKHGDIERDYNYFRMLPEYYSQGNGNFRDVNQNRRMDNFFSSCVQKENINKFYSMIQLDGYNPLAVEKVTYTLEATEAEKALEYLVGEAYEAVLQYVTTSFTPGGFYKMLDQVGVSDEKVQEELFTKVITNARENFNCDFGEGYWSDHWTYNLDLVENYLAIYPERTKEIVQTEEYTYFKSCVAILPRQKRYVMTENGVRQYNFLGEESEHEESEKLVRENYGTGEVVKVSLLEKLLVLNATKFMALDSHGMGVEMEGGKPGWYDALNGLPGLFGSSMAETYELYRNLQFTEKLLRAESSCAKLTEEVMAYIHEIAQITKSYLANLPKDGKASEAQCFEFWNLRNELKESYVAKVFKGISGKKSNCNIAQLLQITEDMIAVVAQGIERALEHTGDVVPTYFAYDLVDYMETAEGIQAKKFDVIILPNFLEGPVRYMKLDIPMERKRTLYNAVKANGLYDRKLKMYKVNASLDSASFELGRAKAFTPGWLENESIWLHMEYKYLLELIKNGLYNEFLEDFQNAAVPFLDPEVYGRSIYENSSFIASSVNPNPNYHGKGFVARLSGSTVEFLQMWKLMMFGENNFEYKNGELSLQFNPTLPKVLVGAGKKVEAMFLGHTVVNYEFAQEKDYIAGDYKIEKIELAYFSGEVVTVDASGLTGELASDVREKRVEKINIRIS